MANPNGAASPSRARPYEAQPFQFPSRLAALQHRDKAHAGVHAATQPRAFPYSPPGSIAPATIDTIMCPF